MRCRQTGSWKGTPEESQWRVWDLLVYYKMQYVSEQGYEMATKLLQVVPFYVYEQSDCVDALGLFSTAPGAERLNYHAKKSAGVQSARTLSPWGYYRLPRPPTLVGQESPHSCHQLV